MKLMGYKFRRQHAINQFVADFINLRVFRMNHFF